MLAPREKEIKLASIYGRGPKYRTMTLFFIPVLTHAVGFGSSTPQKDAISTPTCIGI